MTTVNESIAMTDSATIFTAPTNLTKIEVHAVTGTITLQQRFNGVWASCDVTIATGTFKVGFEIAQGTELRVVGGNAVIHYWA